MSDLPLYSGPMPKCIKCGAHDANTEYRRALTVLDSRHIDWGPEIEHLRRQCRRCGYAWPEAVLE